MDEWIVVEMRLYTLIAAGLSIVCLGVALTMAVLKLSRERGINRVLDDQLRLSRISATLPTGGTGKSSLPNSGPAESQGVGRALLPEVGKVNVACEVAPPGWWCSRGKGHEGPCAARPLIVGINMVRESSGMYRMVNPRAKPGCQKCGGAGWYFVNEYDWYGPCDCDAEPKG